MEVKEQTSSELSLLSDCIDGFLKIPIEKKWFVLGYMQGTLGLATDNKSVKKQAKA